MTRDKKDKTTSPLGDISGDHSVETKKDRQLRVLREVLAKDSWDFSMGSGHFDGIPDGICYLIGIDPGSSSSSSLEYAPSYLPGGLEYNWGSHRPLSSEALHLRDFVHASADRFRDLRLAGLQKVHVAIRTALKYDRRPAWWKEANDDFECAKLLPSELRENPEFAKRIKSEVNRSNANRRVQKNKKSKFIHEFCRPKFEEFRSTNFEGFRARSSDRLMAKPIANAIFNLAIGSDDYGDLPQVETIAEHVKSWLNEEK